MQLKGTQLVEVAVKISEVYLVHNCLLLSPEDEQRPADTTVGRIPTIHIEEINKTSLDFLRCVVHSLKLCGCVLGSANQRNRELVKFVCFPQSANGHAVRNSSLATHASSSVTL
jgi:hypothetical protein